jgi:hypothetical protein
VREIAPSIQPFVRRRETEIFESAFERGRLPEVNSRGNHLGPRPRLPETDLRSDDQVLLCGHETSLPGRLAGLLLQYETTTRRQERDESFDDRALRFDRPVQQDIRDDDRLEGSGRRRFDRTDLEPHVPYVVARRHAAADLETLLEPVDAEDVPTRLSLCREDCEQPVTASEVQDPAGGRQEALHRA